MPDEITIRNWDDHLKISFVNKFERDGLSFCCFNVAARCGLNNGSQNITLPDDYIADFLLELKNILLGDSDKCTLEDRDSPARITMKSTFNRNIEIYGGILRAKPAHESSKQQHMFFKFNTAPETLFDLMRLLRASRSGLPSAPPAD